VDGEELRAAAIEAGRDAAGHASRTELCEALVIAFGKVGELLWVSGAIIGPDRVGGDSPFRFGSDATVGLATVVRIAGELSRGAVALLREGNQYSAFALVRQLVEVEYLAWAFAEDEEEAMNWLRSSQKERMRFWSPRHIRKRAGGRFRGKDYSLHCETGGHPTPDGNSLLLGGARADSDFFARDDLIFHGLGVWDYALSAAGRFGWGSEIRELPEAKSVAAARERREANDPLLPPLRAMQASLRGRRQGRPDHPGDTA
jgi:hypothetical protein